MERRQPDDRENRRDVEPWIPNGQPCYRQATGDRYADDGRGQRSGRHHRHVQRQFEIRQRTAFPVHQRHAHQTERLRARVQDDYEHRDGRDDEDRCLCCRSEKSGRYAELCHGLGPDVTHSIKFLQYVYWPHCLYIILIKQKYCIINHSISNLSFNTICRHVVHVMH